MTNQAYPSLNDVAPSWADIGITITPEEGSILEMTEIAGIKSNRKIELGEQRGVSGGRVMKRTTGSGSAEASMTLYRSGYRTFINALAANAPTRGNQLLIGLVAFDVLIQHTPPGSDDIFTRKIKGCRFTGDADDMKEGNEADKLEISLNPIEIVDIDEDGNEIVLI